MSTNDKELEAVWREIRQWFADKDDALVAARLILAARIKEGFDASYIAQLKEERDETRARAEQAEEELEEQQKVTANVSREWETALALVREWEEGVRGTALRDHREWIANLEESSRYWQAEAERWGARVRELEADCPVEKWAVATMALKERIAQLESEAREENRWEAGFRSIVTWLRGPSAEFEIADIVEQVRQLEAELKAETDEAEGYQKALHVAWAEGAENARLREAFEKADEESDYKSGPEFRLRQRLRAALRNDGGAK